jgi:NADH:ubiquinone oxidoreductase subunit 4 (subunit M)
MLFGLTASKFNTRYYDSLFFFDQQLRIILLCTLLANLGFVLTMNFVGELFALIALFSIDSL